MALGIILTKSAPRKKLKEKKGRKKNRGTVLYSIIKARIRIIHVKAIRAHPRPESLDLRILRNSGRGRSPPSVDLSTYYYCRPIRRPPDKQQKSRHRILAITVHKYDVLTNYCTYNLLQYCIRSNLLGTAQGSEKFICQATEAVLLLLGAKQQIP
jgi:hypothetical protein